LASEDVLPRIFHNAAGVLVLKFSVEEPFAVADVLGARVCADALAGDGKLRAAGLGDGAGDRHVGVEFAPDSGCEEALFVLVYEVPLRLWSIWVQPVGAARVMVAAGVHVALAGDVGVGDAGDGLGGVEVKEDVVMPGGPMWVEEEDGIGEVVVVIDYVGEVDHSFMAFVFGDFEDGVFVVDSVNAAVDVWDFLGPRYIFGS